MNLFKPIVPLQQQHPNFRSICHPDMGCDGEMETLQRWTEGFKDRDGKFVQEFQKTFNSSFWELYLHASFKELGFCADYSHSRPDFVLAGPTDFIAEATIAANPDSVVPEWERDYSEMAIGAGDPAAIIELATIRLAGALRTKQQKYLNEYQHLAHVKGKPYVICLAPFEQPWFYFQSDQAMNRVLYGYDQPIWIENPKTGERTVIGESRIDRVRKESGANIEFGLFKTPGLEHVSAVIFSPVATWGKVRALTAPGAFPVRFLAFRYAQDAQHHRVVTGFRPEYTETLLDGLHVFLNPFAANPLDASVFERDDICVHKYDHSTDTCLVRAEDGFLFFRQTMSHVPSKAPKGDKYPVEVGKHGVAAYKKFVPTPLPEGELVPTNSTIWIAADNHLAHYRGWTVVIYRDKIDNDWGGQAVQKLCKDLVSFRRYNGMDKVRSLMVDDFLPTKEQAFARAKAQIDEVIDGRSAKVVREEKKRKRERKRKRR